MDVHVALGMELGDVPVHDIEKVVSLVGFRCNFSVCTCWGCSRFIGVVTQDVGTFEVSRLDFLNSADNLALRFTLAGSFGTVEDVRLGNFLILVLGHEYIFYDVLDSLDANRRLVRRGFNLVTNLVGQIF